MKTKTDEDRIKAVGNQFQVHGRFLRAFPIGKGHINDTFAADYDYGGRTVRFVHQTINHQVFPNPVGVMENIDRVTRHKQELLAQKGDSEAGRKALTVIPRRNGQLYYQDGDGIYWRTYIFIDRATTFDTIESLTQAREVAKAYGTFQNLLVDLPGGRLNETIPDFHDARKRFVNLMRVVEKDPENRAREVAEEIEFVSQRENVVDILLGLIERGELPERITHNDTKLNNVMIDDATGEAICVVDLDTVMPGSVLYDFGDMVRTATSPALEDERDLSLVTMQLPMFEALVSGYWEATRDFLLPVERDHLAFSGKLLALMIGIRFLTDHIEGDVYFKTHRPGHNLDRARNQFKLVFSMEEQEEEMHRVVDEQCKAR
jgi:hypothetical protein